MTLRIEHGHVFLTAIIDWNSRYIVGWEVDDTLDTRMVINALKKALRNRNGKPEIINSDQGSQFPSQRYIDFVFCKRKWDTSKYGRKKQVGRQRGYRKMISKL